MRFSKKILSKKYLIVWYKIKAIWLVKNCKTQFLCKFGSKFLDREDSDFGWRHPLVGPYRWPRGKSCPWGRCPSPRTGCCPRLRRWQRSGRELLWDWPLKANEHIFSALLDQICLQQELEQSRPNAVLAQKFPPSLLVSTGIQTEA